MIIKPEDALFVAAVTREDLLQQGFGGSAEIQLFIAQSKAMPMFTAAQCAEIATAYAESVGKYINALSPDMEREASDEMDKWQDKFIEWGWMK